MSSKTLQPTKYAKKRYNVTAPIDFDVCTSYGTALMAIAGADGELVEEEFQWFVNEQELLWVNYEEHLEALRNADWKNADMDEVLGNLHFEFPLNARKVILYQAIKMSRADKDYHDKEKAAVNRAAELLKIEHSAVASLEALAEAEDAVDRIRLALFETAV